MFLSGGTNQPQVCTAAPGTYCPPGTSTNTATPCSAGSYCLGGSNPRANCTAASGYDCPVGGSDPSGLPCPMDPAVTAIRLSEYAQGHSRHNTNVFVVTCQVQAYCCSGGSSDKVPCPARPVIPSLTATPPPAWCNWWTWRTNTMVRICAGLVC